MTNNRKFQYPPFNPATEIRVVNLHPCTRGHQNLECDVYHVKLENAEYEALSYEWRDATNSKNITVNGRTHVVRRNLYDALHQLRWQGPGNNRILWIDQLCIDQSNNQEKLHQVQQMKAIYEGAQEVIVWLGKPEKKNTILEEAMDELNIADPPPTQRFGGQNEIQMNRPNPALEVLRCEYWNRVWIWQEVQLSKQFTIYCGDKNVKGERFANYVIATEAIGGLGDRKKMVVDLMKLKARQAEDKAENKAERLTLYTHISNAMRIHLQCSQAQDIVFGMLGMASDGARMIPDYDKPARDLLKQTVEVCLHTSSAPDSEKDRETFVNGLAERFEPIDGKIGNIFRKNLLSDAKRYKDRNKRR